MTQTDLTAVDEPKVTPVPQGPEVPEDTPVTQGPEVPQPDDEYQQLLEQARAGDQGARGKLRGRLMDPLTPPQVKQDITSALQAGAPEEAKEIEKEGDRYRPLWFGRKEATVSLGSMRNAESLGRTQFDPEFLERYEADATNWVENVAEFAAFPVARYLATALGVTDAMAAYRGEDQNIEQRLKELQNDIEFMEARILPKAVQALKDGHSTQEVIQGLAKQGIEADRALGESIDSAFSEEGIDTKGGYARLFSSPGELFIQRVKQLPEEEFSWDVVKRDATRAVPLVGTLLDSADQNRIEDAINRIADNEGTEEDQMLVEGMLIDQYRSRSIGYKAASGVIDMAGFGADLWAGGAVTSTAVKAGTKLSNVLKIGTALSRAAQAVGLAKFNKALSNVAAWSAKTPTSFMSRMGRAGVRGGMEAGRIAGTTAAQVGGEALGSAAVTGAFGEEAVFGRAELETQRQQIMQAISGGIDPVSGKTFFAADRIPEDAPEITLPNAVGLMVDVAVEKLGRFAAMPGLAKTPASRLRMLDSLARAVDPSLADRLANGVRGFASKMEIDGIVGEILEEYASRTGMAAIGEITGDPEYGKLADIIPSGEAIADEFIAIASGAGFMRSAGLATEKAAEAGVTPRARQRLQKRAEYLRDVEAAATDPAAAERVRQVNETTRRATGEEIDTALEGVGGTRVEQPEGLEAEQAAERAKSLGLELVFYDGPAEQTGFYDPSSPSTIYINTKAEDPGAALEIDTTIHEVAHDMEAVIGEEAFDSLTSKLREADPERWDDAKEDARDELGEIFGEGVFRPVGRDAESEAAATRAEDNGVLVDLLLRNPDAQVDIQRILKSDQSLLQRVRDGVRNMLSVLPGVKSAKDKGMENLRAELQKRGLEGEELDAAVEQSQLETADEVAAAMKDVALMRELARQRKAQSYDEGATVSDDALYGTEEDFSRAVDRDGQLRQALFDGVLISKADEEVARRKAEGETDVPTAEQLLETERERLESEYGEEADALVDQQVEDINARPAEDRERLIDEMLGIRPIGAEAAAPAEAPAETQATTELAALLDSIIPGFGQVVQDAEPNAKGLGRLAEELRQESQDERVTPEKREQARQALEALEQAMPGLGIETVDPSIGEESRGNPLVADKPEVVETDDPNLDWTVAEVLEPARVGRDAEGRTVIHPGRVRIYRYRGDAQRTQEAGYSDTTTAIMDRRREEAGVPTTQEAQPAVPARTLAEVEAEIAEIQAKGKKSTLADRRRKKLLQEEADALRDQEAALAEEPTTEEAPESLESLLADAREYLLNLPLPEDLAIAQEVLEEDAQREAAVEPEAAAAPARTPADVDAEIAEIQAKNSGSKWARPTGPQFARRRRRRRKPPEVMDRFDLKPPTRLEKFRMYWVDSLSRLERFEKRAYEKGLRLAQAESPTMAARLVPGKTTYKQELLDTNYIAPIFGVLADAGIKIPEFEDFLILRTTKESNADLREKREQAIAKRQQARILTRQSEKPIDRTLPEEAQEEEEKQRKKDKKEAQRLRREADYIDPGENPKSFYTDEEAEAKLAEIDKNPQLRKALDEAGRLIDEMNKATRKQLLDSGLISQEQHDLWEEKFKHYVPFRSDPDESSWVEMNAGTSGYSVRGPEARVRRGTTRKPQPFLFSVRQAGRAIARGEKNQVGVRAYKFFDKANQIKGIEEVDPHQSAPDLSGTAKFYLKINGEQKIVTLKDEYLARALKNMGPGRKGDPGALDKLIRLASWITRKRANFNTQLNPDFLFTNPIRDQIEAQFKVGELRERKFRIGRTSLLVDTGRFAKHIAGKPTKATEAGPLGDYYRRFGEAGGMIRLGDMQDYQEDMAALEAKLERMSKSPSKFTGMAQLQTALDALSRWNRAAELGVRLSVFKQLVDGGATDAQAAAAARDITVDFNRRGQGTAAINSMYMFFNATMQGTDRNLRALKTKAGRRMAGALMVAGYIHSLTQSLGSDEDEDGRLEWDNEPWYNKARNLAFGYGASKIFKLPLPYFWSLPFLAGQLLDSLTRGVMTPDEASTYLAAATLNDLTPLEFGSDRDTFVNKRTLTQLLPTPLSTASDLIVNLDYRGRPIMRERFPGEKTPARERGTGRPEEMLSGLSQSVVDFVAKMTGQDPMSAPGNIGDWNPDAVEYVITDTFGGLGSSVLRGGKIVEAIFSDEKEAKLGDYPVSRRFFGHAAVGGVSAGYFALKEHIERLESRYRAGDKETRAWLKEQEPTAYKSIQALKRAEERRKSLLNKRDAAKTSEDRKAAEDALEAHLGRFVSSFDEKEAKR